MEEKDAGSSDAGVDSPPSLAFISPLEDEVIVNGFVNIEVGASDDVGVTKVQFFVQDILLDEVVSPPYSMTWSTQNLPHGVYILKAIAFDTSGHTTTRTRQVTLGQESKKKVDVMMDNCDDSCSVFINGSPIRTISLGQTTPWIDVSSYASSAANSNVIRFEVSNNREGWAYGFHARLDGVTVVNDSCGVLYQQGCRNNDGSLGLVYSKEYRF